MAVTIFLGLQLNVHLINERNRADKRKIKTFAGFGGKLEKKRVGKAKVRSQHLLFTMASFTRKWGE